MGYPNERSLIVWTFDQVGKEKEALYGPMGHGSLLGGLPINLNKRIKCFQVD